ncbi:putative membrane protein [Archaeoglobus sulfaticallidus PM70-1]|uniref:Putative membrane protein n=1 Tax=Archaeoglobus sulfaticallidus PM70-1 TaxID=387631 RepID=N0BEX0_9EURY|nr:DUF63 family protein [Archaeoglobus sulfaticallidus]AGK61543.1 putative membrane protein [Archaeoglobus sulfaticallidus PM70-1]
MGIYEFIKKYYIDSLVYKQGYNIVNTLTFAIILILAVVAIYKYLSKRIKFDEKFVIANIPYILLGSSVRVVEDAEFLKPPISYFFMTPFIYIVIFLIAFPTLVISLRKKEDYWKYYAAVGVFLSAAVLAMLFSSLEVIHGWLIPVTLTAAFLFAAAYHFLTRKFYPKMHNGLSDLVFFSHMVDGFATFLGIQFLGYWELHVLPRFLIDTFGAWVMVPSKIIVFLAVLYILDTSEDDIHFVNFIKFVLVVLGLAPGMRDALRMCFAT